MIICGVPNEYKKECKDVSIEFCLRYGNGCDEYRSSWDCNAIERRIDFHIKFADSEKEYGDTLKNLIEFKEKLKGLDCWDADGDLPR